MDDILDSIGSDEKEYEVATKGQRFANYLIDIIIAYAIIFGLSLLYYSMNPELIYVEETDAGLNIMERLIGAFVIAIYYTIIEFSLGGKTIGKYITKTRTVTLNNEKPDFQTILGRSFSRIVPFEAFSFLGSQPDGWHDRWSKTKVIKD